MTSELTARVLAEMADVADHGHAADPRLEAVTSAMILEDVLAVRLSDDDIDAAARAWPAVAATLATLATRGGL